MATFDQDGKPFAFQIGTRATARTIKMFADQILFLEDPHELYKHWPPEIWDAISQHQVKPGMSQMQVTFSVGIGLAQSRRLRQQQRCATRTEAIRSSSPTTTKKSHVGQTRRKNRITDAIADARGLPVLSP